MIHVDIGKDEPIGLWLCPICRDIPQKVKSDVITLKNDIKQLEECTDSILFAVNGLSTKLDNCIGGFQDQLTALSKQINTKDKNLTDSVETLKTTTNNVKSAFDQKSNQILNKTNTIIEKVKSQTEIIKTMINQSKASAENEGTKSNCNPVRRDINVTNNIESMKQCQQTVKPKYKNVQSGPKSSTKSDHRQTKGQNRNRKTDNDNEIIDLTTNVTKKKINQSTLLVGSSLLKGVKNSDLKPNTTVRSDTIGDSISKFDITSCKTIILHVGGNDADSGVDITTFSDNYVSLLNSLEAENRPIIVSGLTPRESVDLKPYNQSLKDICNENDLQFIDNYDSFLLASGEMPESYFYGDKLHLNASGTRRLLSNIDKVHNINRNSPRNDHTISSQGVCPRGNTRQPRG